MKRMGYLLESISEMDNLMSAYYKAKQGKEARAEVQAFALSLQDNLLQLRTSILSGSVNVGNYTYFRIKDPKPRLICAASFPERVLHHAVMNVCHPYFERHLVSTTYATRPGKGLYQAITRAMVASRRYPYVAKFDVRKYFDSVDHQLLKNKLSRIFKDKALLSIFDRIIDSYHTSEPGRGLPIGNLTSQYFANYYLSSLDHFCKERLGVKEYIRYMDDFLVFASTLDDLNNIVSGIQEYVSEFLLLTLKEPDLLLVSEGVPFCGYRLFPHKILLNSRSKRRLMHKLLQYESFLKQGLWSEKDYLDHVTPLLAFSRFAYAKGLRRTIIEYGNRESGSNRVKRGGNNWNDARNCRVSNRNNNTPDNRNNNNGFRLALSL